MKCLKCPKPAKVSFKQLGNFCYSCFAEIIEKRAKKVIIEAGLIKRNSKVLIIDGSTFGKVSEYMFRKIVHSLPITIKVADKKKKSFDYYIHPYTSDDLAEEFFECVLEKKKIREFKKNDILLLKYCTDAEIEIYAKIKKIGVYKDEKSFLGKLLDDVEKDHPGAKASVLRIRQERSLCGRIQPCKH